MGRKTKIIIGIVVVLVVLIAAYAYLDVILQEILKNSSAPV